MVCRVRCPFRFCKGEEGTVFRRVVSIKGLDEPRFDGPSMNAKVVRTPRVVGARRLGHRPLALSGEKYIFAPLPR